MAKKFGQGVKTGIQLPAETSGRFPDPSTWSVSTFGNLPIGQGVSYNLVELASMYQAIANGGVRIAPTIVASTAMNGQHPANPGRDGTQVMSAANARTLLDMLRGTMQGGDTNHRGTAPPAAITGYQVAGKTGTAQKVDPDTNEYSQTAITSTFAGVFPADNPKYVVAIMLDDPKGNSPAGTTSCAPLFHNIAAYLAIGRPTSRHRPPRRPSTTSTSTEPTDAARMKSTTLPTVPKSLRPRGRR